MVQEFSFKQNYDIHDLVEIMSILRGGNGCPWDREQDHKSIRRNFIEETYEAVEAIDTDDTELLREELGDVLLQVVFHSQMEKEKGSFDFGDVCDGICKKLIARHPHIFSNVIADTTEKVLANWDDIKKSQKGDITAADSLRSVSRALPALMRADKLQSRAAKSGFDYQHLDFALGDLQSEMKELTAAINDNNSGQCYEELGDLIFSAVNVGRLMGLDSENSLTASCDKFMSRFEIVERLAHERAIDMKNSDPELLDELWKEAKKVITGRK